MKNPDDLRLLVLVWIDDLANSCLTWRDQWLIHSHCAAWCWCQAYEPTIFDYPCLWSANHGFRPTCLRWRFCQWFV